MIGQKLQRNHRDDRLDNRRDVGNVDDIVRHVIDIGRVLAGDGAEFAPFTENTLIRVSEALGRRVETNDVQRALDALREKSLVWRPSRGIYALEDQDMREWLLADQPG